MNTSERSLLQKPMGAWEAAFNDESGLSSGLKEMERALVRSGNLRFLDSPQEAIYPFATPLLVSRQRHDEVSGWIQKIVRSLEDLGRWLRDHPVDARDRLLFGSPLEQEFFGSDPGFQEMAPIHRVDLILPDEGPPQVMEINCGCPGGELDPALVAGAFLSSSLAPKLRKTLKHYFNSHLKLEYQDPRDDSLNHLMRCYGAFRAVHPSFPDSPTIGLITSSGQARFMIPECRGIAEHYRSRGYRTLIGDLLELEPRGHEVLLGGEPVHLVFRKFSTLSFRLRMEKPERFGKSVSLRVRRIWEAVALGRLCMVNPLGSTALQDKGLLEILRSRDPELQHVIPQTYILGPELPTADPPLWEEIQRGEAFVLKRRHSFDGRHVVLNPAEIKERVPNILQGAPAHWVAQRRVPAPRYPFGVCTEGEVHVGHFHYNINPFGRSCFVRVGLGGPYDPVNAHRGGAATCAFVIERQIIGG